MKRSAHAIFLSIALAVSATAYSADRLRAHYELNVREGTDLKTVQYASDVKSDVPIEIALDKYKVVLLFDVAPANSYVLTVSLISASSSSDVIVKGTFNGSLVGSNAGPLEFDLERNGVKLSGAVALSWVGR
jgi:hypothetical protein